MNIEHGVKWYKRFIECIGFQSNLLKCLKLILLELLIIVQMCNVHGCYFNGFNLVKIDKSDVIVTELRPQKRHLSNMKYVQGNRYWKWYMPKVSSNRCQKWQMSKARSKVTDVKWQMSKVTLVKRDRNVKSDEWTDYTNLTDYELNRHSMIRTFEEYKK